MFPKNLAAALVVCIPLADGPQRIDSIGPVGEVVKLHDGFQFTEGPAWDGRGNLYFSDIPANRIYRVDRDGKKSVFLDDTGGCNGLAFNAAGVLHACQGGKGRVIAIDTGSKKITVLAEQCDGKRLGAPNDLALDRAGGIYFTDPDAKPGVYYRAADGKVSRLPVKVRRPNGVVLAPDEKTLYVIPSGQAEMMAYSVENPGQLGAGRVFCTLVQPKGQKGTGGDGAKVDTKGNLYIATRAGVQVYDSRGKLRGVIAHPDFAYPNHPANLAFGGAKMRTLFICARKAVYRADMEAAGNVFPGK